MTIQAEKNQIDLPSSHAAELRELMSDSSAIVELFNPKYHHVLKTHEHDELYFVASGTADLVIARSRHVCQAGDRIAVPALVPHYFDRISEDFASWAVLLTGA